jgi:predicted TIM-barrel fold metal-dependent hydrolase
MLDAAGIERALVLSAAYLWGSPALSVEDEYASVRRENEWTLAQVAPYAKRLRAFCSFNPLKPYALEELARCAGTHHGLKLHLANSDVQLDVPAHVERLQDVFAGANRAGMPIVVHLRANIGKRRPYGTPQARTFIDEVLSAAPHVPVQIAHLAGTGPGYDDPPAHRALEAFARAADDRDRHVERLWFDVAGLATLDMTAAEAGRMANHVRRLGRSVLYGSDAATGGNPPPREAWAAFARLPLTPDELGTLATTQAPYAH